MVAESLTSQDRQAIIAELANRLADQSPQFGKTVLMKLMYLLQEVYGLPLGYRFSFYTYGPYSTEVLTDLDLTKLIDGVKVQFFGADPGGYEISLGLRNEALRSARKETLDRFNTQLEALTSHFGDFRARDLELRSTIVYIWRHTDPDKRNNRAELMNVIRQLKPHFSEDEVEQAIRELQDAGILEGSSERS